MRKSIKSVSSITEEVKEKIKNFHIFYEICRFILNPGIRFFPLKRNMLLESILSLENSKVLNVGSGCLKIPKATNVDIYPFRNVDVVSDANNLPFCQEKFDAVILENLLEHVVDPVKVVKESYRVLKQNGIVLVEVPFQYEFHNSPCDYYRFTLQGIEKLLKNFRKIESGISIGPTGTLNGVLRNYLALIFSFNNTVLFELFNMLFGLIFFPLKLLDFLLIKFKDSHRMSSAFYFIGKK